LPDILGNEILQGGDDSYYRVSDKLLKYQEQIIGHLRRTEQKYFNLQRTVFLYDLTNTYFEGTALENPKAHRGCSKHKRNDCPQIVVGMVFDNNGFEIGHKIFEGNRNDSTTIEEMLVELKKVSICDDTLFEEIKPVVVLDGGIATKKNLKILKDNNYSYLVNDSRRGRGKYKEEFLADALFTKISGRENKGEVLVRLMDDSCNEANQTDDRILLCKSSSRRLKETAMRSKIEERFIEELEKLKSSIDKKSIREKEAIERKIGKLQSRYTRASRFYDIELKEENAVKELRWELKEEKYKEADLLFGCYVIRTDRKDITEEEIWNLYMTLTKAEDGFRMLKSNLGIRPNYHRIEDRVDGHVLITVLAYHLLHFIMYKLQQTSDHRSWPTIKRILSTHCYSTIIVPTINGTVYRIRKPGIPDKTQEAIYKVLGIDWKKLPRATNAMKSGAR
jgi:transposase